MASLGRQGEAGRRIRASYPASYLNPGRGNGIEVNFDEHAKPGLARCWEAFDFVPDYP